MKLPALFSGARLFALKDSRGFPLEIALDRIINDEGMTVEWSGFIEAARANGWWDFQTYEVMQHALQDAGVDRAQVEQILARARLYIMVNTHPAMTEPA